MGRRGFEPLTSCVSSKAKPSTGVHHEPGKPCLTWDDTPSSSLVHQPHPGPSGVRFLSIFLSTRRQRHPTWSQRPCRAEPPGARERGAPVPRRHPSMALTPEQRVPRPLPTTTRGLAHVRTAEISLHLHRTAIAARHMPWRPAPAGLPDHTERKGTSRPRGFQELTWRNLGSCLARATRFRRAHSMTTRSVTTSSPRQRPRGSGATVGCHVGARESRGSVTCNALRIPQRSRSCRSPVAAPRPGTAV